MSLLEQLALTLADYPTDQTCAGPNCCLLVEETEVFCSLACRIAFDAWAEELRTFHDQDHELRWTEL